MSDDDTKVVSIDQHIEVLKEGEESDESLVVDWSVEEETKAKRK